MTVCVIGYANSRAAVAKFFSPENAPLEPKVWTHYSMNTLFHVNIMY